MIEAFLEASALAAIPLLFAALGALLTERSGLVNIGVEGIVLSGALAGALGASSSGEPLLGLCAAVLVGAVMGLAFGYFCSVRGADPIVMGLSLNLVAVGLTGAAFRAFFGRTGSALILPTLPSSVFFVLAVLSASALHVFFHRTRWGLSVIAAGEQPQTAMAAGVKVPALRTHCAAIGGGFAGLAGASLSLCLSDTFIEGMSAGRGFVALAIVILGRREPLGAAAAALFFGGIWALQFRLQAAQVTDHYQFLLMAPYLATLLVLVLAGFKKAKAGLNS